jgi:hypothetical protein
MLDVPRRAGAEAETQAAIHVAHMQKDGLLLLTHLAETSSRSLVAG